MGRREKIKEEMLIKWIYILSIILSISILIFLFVFYLRKDTLLKSSYDSEIAYVESIETTSSEDKSKNEVINKLINNNVLVLENKIENVVNKKDEIKENEVKEVKVENKVEEVKNEIVENIVNDENNNEINYDNTNVIVDENIDLNSNDEFKIMPPVQGEIIKDFAKDTLLYSKTLDEWCTHLGVDIKVDKASLVVAAADGVIEKITKDPRYGNSITIDHQNGFKSVYSSLLVTDFVNVGENVVKGESIGTVGETASIEMLDDCHLHFELYKDEECVNPTLYF